MSCTYVCVCIYVYIINWNYLVAVDIEFHGYVFGANKDVRCV